MTFAPIIPMGGPTGWQFLQRTMDRQREIHAQSAQHRQEVDRFRATAGDIASAEDLVDNYAALKVTLGAFGLQEDIGSHFFIEKVLGEGAIDPESFANRLSDKRYLAMADAFDFDVLGGGRLRDPAFVDGLVQDYTERAFEVAVGEVDPDMRLALGFDRELDTLLDTERSADGDWFAVMGTPPVRAVFAQAMGLPDSVAALDIDQQLSIFRGKAEALFGEGEVRALAGDDLREEVRTAFLQRSDAATTAVVSSPVLSLLSGSGSAAGILSALYQA